MSWTKLDDLWSEKIEEAIGQDIHARWHYIALIQLCSRLDARDGIISRSKAERCSDLPDTLGAIRKLVEVGLVADHGSKVRVVRAAEHVISEAKARETERKREDQRRSRAHRDGDHALCESGQGDRPKDCKWATAPKGDVTGDGSKEIPHDSGQLSTLKHSTTSDSHGDVTGVVGTGRAGTGKELPDSGEEVDLQTGEITSAPIRHESRSSSSYSDVWPDDPPVTPEGFGSAGDFVSNMQRQLRERRAG